MIPTTHNLVIREEMSGQSLEKRIGSVTLISQGQQAQVTSFKIEDLILPTQRLQALCRRLGVWGFVRRDLELAGLHPSAVRMNLDIQYGQSGPIGYAPQEGDVELFPELFQPLEPAKLTTHVKYDSTQVVSTGVYLTYL